MLIPHDPSVHTFESRREQVDRVVSGDSSAVIVGSVARCALLGYEVPTLKEQAFARDIDVTSITGESAKLPSNEASAPFPLDRVFLGLITVDGNTANVRYRKERPDISVELPAEVFEPYTVQVAGMKFQTFHPDTLLNVHRIVGTYNPRVWANLRSFRRGLQSQSYTRIASTTFEPLNELQRMAAGDSELRKQKLTEQVMALYDYFAPAYVRHALQPLASRLLRNLGVETRQGTIVAAEQ